MALIKISHKQNTLIYFAICSWTFISAAYRKCFFMCITFIEEKLFKSNIIEKYVVYYGNIFFYGFTAFFWYSNINNSNLYDAPWHHARHKRCARVRRKTLCTDNDIAACLRFSPHTHTLDKSTSMMVALLSCDYTILSGENKNLNRDKSNAWKTIEVVGGQPASRGKKQEWESGKRLARSSCRWLVWLSRDFFFFQALGWVEETEDGSRKDRSSSLIQVSGRKSK